MKYKIYDKINKEFLPAHKYCINQMGDVMTTKGLVLMNQNDFEVVIEDEITTIEYVGINSDRDSQYQCEKCGCLDILSSADYCPQCGRKFEH